MTLGIPLVQLDKVFLGHLHLDHAGDFPEFFHRPSEQLHDTCSSLGLEVIKI